MYVYTHMLLYSMHPHAEYWAPGADVDHCLMPTTRPPITTTPVSTLCHSSALPPCRQEMPTPDLAVEFRATAEAELQALAPTLRLFGDCAQAKQALCEVLAGDPRPCPPPSYTDMGLGWGLVV